MPGGGVLQLASLLIYAVVLILAAWRDWRTLRIADGFSLTIISAYGLWAASGMASDHPSLAEIAASAAIALAFLVLGVVAFAAGAVGGGDVKLLAAAVLFAGSQYLETFMLVLALAGGALSLLALMGLAGNVAPAGDGRRRVPYGPAIAAAGLAVALARLSA